MVRAYLLQRLANSYAAVTYLEEHFIYQRLFQHTFGTHPLTIYQQAIKGFLSLLARGIAWGVLYGCVVIFLEFRKWLINNQL